jgi:hypothetical protein
MPGKLPEFIPVHERLLVTCLCNSNSIDELRRSFNNLPEFELELLINSAFRQGVPTLLFSRLKTSGLLSALPKYLSDKLQQEYLSNAAYLTKLYYDFKRIVELLQADRIECIVLKGVHLAAAVYDNRSEREMCDIDLLVKRTDIVRAGNLLLQHGFGSPDYNPSDATCEWVHQLKPLVNSWGNAVELHWTLSMAGPNNAMPIDLDALWQRSEEATIDSVQTRVLCPEDLLLHLCVHLIVVHQFDVRLRGLYDIHAVVNLYGSTINWEEMLERTEEWEVQKSVLFALKLAKELFDTPIPEHVLSHMNCPELQDMVNTALGVVFSESMVGSMKSIPLMQILKTKGVFPTLTLASKKLFYPKEFITSIYNVSPDTPVLKLYALRAKNMLSVFFSNLQKIKEHRNSGQTAAFALDQNIDRIMDWLKK